MEDLHEKFPGNRDLVDKVFGEWKDKHEQIMEKAGKFKALLLSRYGRYQLPYNKLMKKAKKYAKKYNLSDQEFSEFMDQVMETKEYAPVGWSIPNTKMAKLLGVF